MRILNLASRDERGGAARAASLLHAGLRRAGVESSMLVRARFGDDPFVRAFMPSRQPDVQHARTARAYALAQQVDAYAASRPPWCERFSDDRSDIGAELVSQLPPADVITVHWVSGFVDYAAVVPALTARAPVVWVLHDLNPFTGGCHYDADCGRYVSGCGACPQLGSRAPDDLASQIWTRKRALFDALPANALHVVALSRWLADCARRSMLSRFPVSVIPPGVDAAVFAPRDRVTARARLGIPLGTYVVLFIATSLQNPRKGFRHVADAVAALSGAPAPLLLTVGRDDPAQALAVPRRHLGLIEDDARLAEVYSAADVTVAPSSQDNAPLTVLESLACGTPVVAFDSGGIPDFVRPGCTGALVPPGNTRALSEALAALWRDPARREQMRTDCRQVVLTEYSLDGQARRHLDLYRTLRRSGSTGLGEEVRPLAARRTRVQ